MKTKRKDTHLIKDNTSFDDGISSHGTCMSYPKGFVKEIKPSLCSHGLPMFQTCRKCNRIMVNEEPFHKGMKYIAKMYSGVNKNGKT